MVRAGGGSDRTPPCSRLVCRLPCPYRRAASGAERADRPLCSLVAQVAFDATSSSMSGELLPPHLPYLPSHVLTYSHLACPWSQSFDRREGHHQVHLLLGICRRAEPPRGSCRRAAPRHAAGGRVGPLAAGRGSLVGERARVAARAGVRASADACGRPCRGGRSSCGRPLSCELTRRGRRQGGPVGQPRRPHCGAVSGARTDAGIDVACAGVAVDPAQCSQCFVWNLPCECNV